MTNAAALPQRGPVVVDWAAEAAPPGHQLGPRVRHTQVSRPEAKAALRMVGRTLQSVRMSLGVARSPAKIDQAKSSIKSNVTN